MSREPIQSRPPVQAEQSIADEFALMSVDPVAFTHYHEEEAICSTELTEEAERLIQDLGGDRSRALEKIAKFFGDREEAAVKENEAKEEAVASASQKSKRENANEEPLFEMETSLASAQVFSGEEEFASPNFSPISAAAFLIPDVDLETGFERGEPIIYSSQEVGRGEPEPIVERVSEAQIPSPGIVAGALLIAAIEDFPREKDFENPIPSFRNPLDPVEIGTFAQNPTLVDSVKAEVVVPEFSSTPWKIVDEEAGNSERWAHGAGVFVQNIFEPTKSPSVAGDGASFPLAVGGKGLEETGEVPYIFVPFLPPALVQRREAVGGSMASVGSNLSRPSQRVESKTESGQTGGDNSRGRENPSDHQPGQQKS